MISTYQTRVTVFRSKDRAEGEAALAAYAELYWLGCSGSCSPTLQPARSPGSLKRVYLERYRIPARMFNALRVSLEGKVASVREAQKLHRDTLHRRISRAERQISDAGKQGRWQQVHQKRRRLGNLRATSGSSGIGHSRG